MSKEYVVSTNGADDWVEYSDADVDFYDYDVVYIGEKQPMNATSFIPSHLAAQVEDSVNERIFDFINDDIEVEFTDSQKAELNKVISEWVLSQADVISVLSSFYEVVNVKKANKEQYEKGDF